MRSPVLISTNSANATNGKRWAIRRFMPDSSCCGFSDDEFVGRSTIFRPLSTFAAGLAPPRTAYTLTVRPLFGNRTPVQAFSQCRMDRSRPEQALRQPAVRHVTHSKRAVGSFLIATNLHFIILPFW